MSGHLDRAKQELKQAPLLFSDLPESVKNAVEAQEQRGEWTGERLFQRNPELYMAIVRMLGAEMPVQSIARLLAVSDNTVRAVRERETSAIADFRTKQGVRRRKALNMAMDRIVETLPSADLKDAVIAYGILDDKERLDSGAPTQRIEIAHAPATAVYEEFVRQIIDIEAETVPGTGFGGDGSGQMREGAVAGSAGGAGGGGQAALAAPGASADTSSDDCKRNDDNATADDTEGRAE